MCLVAERDMRDELFTLKSFRYPDSLLPYIISSLEHCKAMINLRVPMDEATTFLSHWPLHGHQMTCPSTMIGRGQCTRRFDSFYSSAQWRLALRLLSLSRWLYLALPRLDLIVSVCLLEFVLSCLFTNVLSYFFVFYLVICSLPCLPHATCLTSILAKEHLTPPLLLTPLPVGLVVCPSCLRARFR